MLSNVNIPLALSKRRWDFYWPVRSLSKTREGREFVAWANKPTFGEYPLDDMGAVVKRGDCAPYELLNSNGQCPDAIIVHYPFQRCELWKITLWRNNHESDAAFEQNVRDCAYFLIDNRNKSKMETDPFYRYVNLPYAECVYDAGESWEKDMERRRKGMHLIPDYWAENCFNGLMYRARIKHSPDLGIYDDPYYSHAIAYNILERGGRDD